MNKPLRVLMVEDSEDDALFVSHELQRGGFDLTIERVEEEPAFVSALAAGEWDLIIADYSLPRFNALAALRALQKTGLDLPFLIVSGAIGEEIAVSAMKSGVQDYILKNNLARLVPAVERELRDAQVRRERRGVEETCLRLAAIVESSGDAIIGKTWDGVITTWNSGAERLFGFSESEVRGHSTLVLLPPDKQDEEVAVLEKLKRGEPVAAFETARLRKDGRRIDVSVTFSPIFDSQGRTIGVSAIARDITERKRAETSLAAFSKLGQRLSTVSTPREAAYLIGNIADELFSWDAFVLDLYDPEVDLILTVLNVDTVTNRRQEVASTYVGERPSSTARRVIEHGAELILRDDERSMLPGAIPFGDVARPSASLMFVPIRNQAKVIGLLSVQSYRRDAYERRDLSTLQALADYCGGALERIRAREELRLSRERLRALAARLQSIREEERKRIAREIHDEFGQALTGFKMDLAWMRNRLQGQDDVPASRQALLDKIKTMGGLLDDNAGLIRKLCTELRPGVLDDLGLPAAIEWQAREFQNRTSIECALEIELGESRVDPERSVALFRMFQEILTNVTRHARASRVDVRLDRTDTKIVLEVRDNGRGIKEAEKIGTKSLGLVGLRERALILGGEVEIKGREGKGTTVRVTVPLSDSVTARAVTSSEEAQSQLERNLTIEHS
jgi:PAS domain S-box-containing protein